MTICFLPRNFFAALCLLTMFAFGAVAPRIRSSRAPRLPQIPERSQAAMQMFLMHRCKVCRCAKGRPCTWQ